MKKIIKIKESKVLDIVNNIIKEQSTGAQEVTVSASNSLGVAPNFDGLRGLLKTLKINVEKALRGNVPYAIKTDAREGVAKAAKEGGSLKLTVTLVPTTEAERDWYFDGSLAIYSAINTDSLANLKATVLNKAANKAQGFSGAEDEANVLGKNVITLSSFKGLDPNDAEKVYKLYLVYIGAKRPDGYQDVTDDSTETNVEEPVGEPQTPAPVAAAPVVGTAKKEVAETTRTINGSFTSNDGDSAHNFKKLETEIGPILEDLYKQGINPKIYSVTAKITKTNSGFSTSYQAKIKNSDDGKAWMGFTSRGSFGNDYIRRADGQISGSSNEDGRSLDAKLKGIGAGETAIIGVYEDAGVPVKQYFVQFTKPKQYPAH